MPTLNRMYPLPWQRIHGRDFGKALNLLPNTIAAAPPEEALLVLKRVLSVGLCCCHTDTHTDTHITRT